MVDLFTGYKVQYTQNIRLICIYHQKRRHHEQKKLEIRELLTRRLKSYLRSMN